jgi:hypothetical protein
MKKPNLKSMINEAFENVEPYRATKSRGMQKPLSEEDLKKWGIIPNKATVNEEYVESMDSIELANALGIIKTQWDKWKSGPLTEPGDIKPAQKELIGWVSRFLKQNIK